ncbi:phosphate ABC transporter permease subunit PstC [Staphylococcus sp. HMSC071G07]
MLLTTPQINVSKMIEDKQSKAKVTSDKVVPKVLALIALISILTTLGILVTLLTETITFFTRIPLTEFLFTAEWSPFTSSPKYGIWALIIGTLKITVIATIVAVPIGLGSAIYLSEYASKTARKIIKPTLELLSGIPTIVFGFFALTFVTPLLRSIFPDINSFNSISPGIVVGIMIIPLISSMSEDAMSSVPNKVREGALGMGATKFEVARKVIVPAATSGIMASIVLAISRALGETMIVSLAAGSTPSSSFDLTNSIQTMTGYIVQVATGDATFGSTAYYSIYAVGFTLFIFTIIMNLISQWITHRFREEY